MNGFVKTWSLAALSVCCAIGASPLLAETRAPNYAATTKIKSSEDNGESFRAIRPINVGAGFNRISTIHYECSGGMPLSFTAVFKDTVEKSPHFFVTTTLRVIPGRQSYVMEPEVVKIEGKDFKPLNEGQKRRLWGVLPSLIPDAEDYCSKYPALKSSWQGTRDGYYFQNVSLAIPPRITSLPESYKDISNGIAGRNLVPSCDGLRPLSMTGDFHDEEPNGIEFHAVIEWRPTLDAKELYPVVSMSPLIDGTPNPFTSEREQQRISDFVANIWELSKKSCFEDMAPEHKSPASSGPSYKSLGNAALQGLRAG